MEDICEYVKKNECVVIISIIVVLVILLLVVLYLWRSNSDGMLSNPAGLNSTVASLISPGTTTRYNVELDDLGREGDNTSRHVMGPLTETNDSALANGYSMSDPNLMGAAYGGASIPYGNNQYQAGVPLYNHRQRANYKLSSGGGITSGFTPKRHSGMLGSDPRLSGLEWTNSFGNAGNGDVSAMALAQQYYSPESSATGTYGAWDFSNLTPSQQATLTAIQQAAVTAIGPSGLKPYSTDYTITPVGASVQTQNASSSPTSSPSTSSPSSTSSFVPRFEGMKRRRDHYASNKSESALFSNLRYDQGM